MNQIETKDIILKVFSAIAPEIDPKDIIEEEDFRDQFDFDSMDFLNFVIGLSKELKTDIPERDYMKLSSLKKCLAYLVL